ncbi:MAG: deoxyhypusine synthase [Deltaproteobacteria bacterium]|nr:deoxyhypusine synthase [Deltaproteobacteria bacterium]
MATRTKSTKPLKKYKPSSNEQSLGGHAIVGKSKSRFLTGNQILPDGIKPGAGVRELIDETFLAYNAARLREACKVFTESMLEDDVTIGMSLTGAMTPAGIGKSCLIPLMRAGFVDWMISTGANLYHDAHFGLKKRLVQGSPHIDDRILRKEGVIRIYDILFDYDVLLSTDAFFREVIQHDDFQKPMSTAEFHWLCGKYLAEREKALGIDQLGDSCVLTAAYRCGVPIYTSSPGDSSIGMNVAAMALRGSKLSLDVSRDVNETAAIVYGAKKGFGGKKGKSGVLIVGGGSPKNFLLQTEPQIQEVLGLDEKGHDFFLQITDARPDTGGLSGATPSEAVSWGKVDPDKLPDTVVCYCDSTIALPLMTAYALDAHKPRKLKRLFDRREKLYASLQSEYLKRVSK